MRDLFSVLFQPLLGVRLGIGRDLLRLIRGFRAAVRVKEIVTFGREIHRHLIARGIAERADRDLLHHRSGIGIKGLGFRRLDHDFYSFRYFLHCIADKTLCQRFRRNSQKS